MQIWGFMHMRRLKTLRPNASSEGCAQTSETNEPSWRKRYPPPKVLHKRVNGLVHGVISSERSDVPLRKREQISQAAELDYADSYLGSKGSNTGYGSRASRGTCSKKEEKQKKFESPTQREQG
ncbi:hypothetical protein M9H77_20632 [Catharanthus roseus]|uniref:Uncharacterized protein n=1 Tax=Catharanthus roseus TaxID=4058 RepID=A0ACC0AL62_CATRO|nr:hypothetical protein M9H77_20632 [Catharanthus roseus]